MEGTAWANSEIEDQISHRLGHVDLLEVQHGLDTANWLLSNVKIPVAYETQLKSQISAAYARLSGSNSSQPPSPFNNKIA
jgi:hypothetical protein